MVDTVTTKTLFDSPKRLIVQLTNVSDGTGEAAVIKVDKSTFTGQNKLEPSKLGIEKIEYDVSNMRVLLQWDQTTDETIAVLQGHGVLDYWEDGKHSCNIGVNTGGTGDILLTTAGQAVGEGYTIKLHLRKKD